MYAYVGDELVSAVDAVYDSLWAEVSYGGRLNDNYLLVYLCRNERERGLQSSVPRFIRLKASGIFNFIQLSAGGHLLPSPRFSFEVLRWLEVTAYVETCAL